MDEANRTSPLLFLWSVLDELLNCQQPKDKSQKILNIEGVILKLGLSLFPNSKSLRIKLTSVSNCRWGKMRNLGNDIDGVLHLNSDDIYLWTLCQSNTDRAVRPVVMESCWVLQYRDTTVISYVHVFSYRSVVNNFESLFFSK